MRSRILVGFQLNKIHFLTSRRNYGLLNASSLHKKHDLSPDFGTRRYVSIEAMWNSLSTSCAVQTVQKSLVDIHDISGLPWWGSIVLSTCLFRSTVTFPLMIYQLKISARLSQIREEMPQIAEELKKEILLARKLYGWSENIARQKYQVTLKKQWTDRIVRDNCHPLKTVLVVWIQLPFWLFQSIAYRNLVNMIPDADSFGAQLIYTQLSVGGFAWIPNLTVTDSSLILPVLLGALNLAIIEIQSSGKRQSKVQKYAINFVRLLSIGMIPIAANVPACLVVYWVSSSTFGVLQSLIIKTASFQRILGLPEKSS